MSKSARTCMIVLAIFSASGLPAEASVDLAQILAVKPVADAELADIRGGFFTAAGAQFDFGATVTTMVNGQLALQTSVNWTNAGATVQQLSGLGAGIQSQVASNLAKAGIPDPVTGSGTAGAAVTAAPIIAPAATTIAPAAAAATTQPSLGAVTPQIATAIAAPASVANIAAPVTQAVSPAATVAATSVAAPPIAVTPVAAAPAVSPAVLSNQISPAAVSPSQPTTVATITNIVPSATAAGTGSPAIVTGVQLQSASGTTQVLTNIGANQLQNILINSASNQTIVQNTNVIFTIYNFSDWQKQISQNSISTQLANEIMAAAGLGGSR